MRLARERKDEDSRSKRIRVLVMDDDEAIRNVASDMLEVLGYEVDVVADGAGAVERYRESRESGKEYRAVIMDLITPGGMGALEALRQLRLLDPEVRVIVSSGHPTHPVLSDFRKHGFCGIVTKPYTLKELNEALTRALGEA